MAGSAIDADSRNFDEVVIRGSAARPVVVDFWAPWCGPCRSLAPILEKLAAEGAGRWTLVKLNTDDEPEIASRYGIRGIPNVKAFRDGQVVDEFTGALPESQVRAWLARIVPSPAAAAVAQAKARLASKDAVGALAKLDEVHALDPDDEDAMLTRAEALVVLDRAVDAGHVLDALETPQRRRTKPVRDENRLAALRARVKLAASGGDLASLRARAEATGADATARLAYANALAAAGRHDAALATLIALIEADRAYVEDARRAMLTIFEALGQDSDLARQYRRSLAAAVNR
ncbi:MAG: thioredoxin [Burkholderiales bacterium]|nr:thioredoxin [Burkholderiales bacterium]